MTRNDSQLAGSVYPLKRYTLCQTPKLLQERIPAQAVRSSAANTQRVPVFNTCSILAMTLSQLLRRRRQTTIIVLGVGQSNSFGPRLNIPPVTSTTPSLM
jgi:hypothetical protein